MRTVQVQLCFGFRHFGEPVSFAVDVPVGFQPDEIFAAANRVLDLQEEPQRLVEWQMVVRRRLDAYQCPSMSVGDFFDVVVGNVCVRWSVLPLGFDVSTHVLDGTF